MSDVKRVLPANLFKPQKTTANSLGGLPNNGTSQAKLVSEVFQSREARVNFAIFEEIVVDNDGTQTNGFQSNNVGIQIITSPTPDSAVKLTKAQTGLTIRMVNNTEAGLIIYPILGDKMKGVTDDAFILTAATSVTFIAVSGDNWINI